MLECELTRPVGLTICHVTEDQGTTKVLTNPAHSLQSQDFETTHQTSCRFQPDSTIWAPGICFIIPDQQAIPTQSPGLQESATLTSQTSSNPIPPSGLQEPSVLLNSLPSCSPPSIRGLSRNLPSSSTLHRAALDRAPRTVAILNVAVVLDLNLGPPDARHIVSTAGQVMFS